MRNVVKRILRDIDACPSIPGCYHYAYHAADIKPRGKRVEVGIVTVKVSIEKLDLSDTEYRRMMGYDNA